MTSPGPVTFTVPGKPHGKPRPRLSTHTKVVGGEIVRSAHVYQPGTDKRGWRETIAFYARQAKVPYTATETVSVVIVVTRKAAKTRKAPRGPIPLGMPARGRSDSANIIAEVHDALQGIAYADDAQVSSTKFQRVWGDRDETAITVARDPIAPT